MVKCSFSLGLVAQPDVWIKRDAGTGVGEPLLNERYRVCGVPDTFLYLVGNKGIYPYITPIIYTIYFCGSGNSAKRRHGVYRLDSSCSQSRVSTSVALRAARRLRVWVLGLVRISD